MKHCNTCQSPLKLHKAKLTPEKMKKQYYYTSYYYCANCKKIYLDDQFKVFNHPYGLFEEKEKPKHIDVEIWTDGACIYNGADNARAAWAFVAGRVEQSGLVAGKQTNNTAESYAVYHALLWAVEKGYKRIRVHSDSQITIGNLRKHYRYVKANQEIFRLIQDVIAANNLTVWYEKVEGHAGDPNNERADKLANALAATDVL